MSEYKDLQEKAKKLGLPYVGVSTENLKKSIEEAESTTGNPPEGPQDPEDEDQKEDPKEANVAIVYNGRHEVRRYSLAIHGENFAELAESFVSSPDRSDYEIKLRKLEEGVVCPSCHYNFIPA